MFYFEKINNFKVLLLKTFCLNFQRLTKARQVNIGIKFKQL